MPPTKATWDGTDSQGNPLRWDQPGLVWGGNIPEPKNKTKKMQLRVNLGFANAPDHTLEETAGAVSDNLYGKPAYPTPPVTQPNLQAGLTALTESIAAQVQGGTAATAHKNNMRDALIDLLRQLAGYVQENHGNDLAVLLSSGFEAVSTSRASSPLDKPRIKDILNGNSGQLILRGTPIPNARCFEVRFAAIGAGGAPGPWQSAGLITNSRSMPVNGLTPGTMYVFQIRAVGGSTGYSDWSDAVQHMSL